MTTDKQIAANRRNAQLSTGPVTPKGKATVSRNAIKHGILARESLIAGRGFDEDAQEFEDLLSSICADLAPEGALENLLCQQITACYWRLRRVLDADTTAFGHLLKDRLEAAAADGGAYPRRLHYLPSAEFLNRLSRYEASVERELYRALAQLDRLQTRRTQTHAPKPLP